MKNSGITVEELFKNIIYKDKVCMSTTVVYFNHKVLWSWYCGHWYCGHHIEYVVSHGSTGVNIDSNRLTMNL